MKKGFTIVELLVVIVVIGILAAITIVSYTGISSKAITASLQSDLSNASKKLKMYQVEYGSFPESPLTDNCPTEPDTDDKYCIMPSPGNTFIYSSTSPSTYTLTANLESSSTGYSITNDSLYESTVTIGTQTWMRYNLDVGTRVNIATLQTDNSVLEKWCSNDTDSNCTPYGGLYQWNEMMQYSTTSGIQGICPTGFHLPTDTEFKILEMNLGMTEGQAGGIDWRGTNQGTQLKLGGTSGWNGLFGGFGRNSVFSRLGTYGYFWTSTQEDDSYSLMRSLSSSESPAQVYRTFNNKAYGFSVRCILN